MSAEARSRLDFETDGRDWPNRATSRFVRAGRVRFHVQISGEGPVLLLLHGTGASTHSWRDLVPLLSRHFTVVAPDLPGHGFSDDPGMNGLSITGMARSLRALLNELGLEPEYCVGHSAGAALLVRMALDGQISTPGIISINGALMPFGGFISQFFSPIARVLATLPMMTTMFAWRARDPRVIDDILRQTGSKLDTAGIALYCRLASNSDHVGAALGMMANWDLHSLERDIPRLKPRLVLLVGQRDEMVTPSVARDVKQRLPTAQVMPLSGLGHLAHEENPALLADIIRNLASVPSSTEATPAPKAKARPRGKLLTEGITS